MEQMEATFLNRFFKGLFTIGIILFAQQSAIAQLTIEKTSHDFGDVTATSNRIVDFYLVNQYQFTIVPSTFQFDWELSTASTPISLEPGDTLLYRVKINPDKTGEFHKTIPLTFFRLSDTVFLDLRANVLTTDFEDNTPLELFDDKPGKNDEAFKDFPVRFKILDLETKEPIPNASISFTSSSPAYRVLKTDDEGKATRILHNLYDVSIFAMGYESVTIGISLGCNDSVRTVLLPKYDPNKKREYEYFYEYEAQNPIKIIDTLDQLEPSEEEILLEPLAKGNYKPNNIVFLMDVSISMKDHDRMALLKSSIIQLVELMRPEDNISIITFSEDTKLIVPPTYLNKMDRSDIIRIIKSLKPGGMTNGGKGLKMAFKLIREHFSEDKNNQVILATDGALGAYMKHDDIVKLVKKNTLYATTSVVTLNGYNWSGNFMREIAKAGGGKLLPINNEKEAKLMLIRNIKANSVIE